MYSVQVLRKLIGFCQKQGGSSSAEVGGTHMPKHFGQSGQPNPAPVARTKLPKKIKKTVASTVATANCWNEFSLFKFD